MTVEDDPSVQERYFIWSFPIAVDFSCLNVILGCGIYINLPNLPTPDDIQWEERERVTGEKLIYFRTKN